MHSLLVIIQQLSCVSSTRRSQTSDSSKKTYCSKKPQTKTPPKSLKLWQQVRYSLFLILIKQRFENNYNVNFLFFLNILNCLHGGGDELGRKGREWNGEQKT